MAKRLVFKIDNGELEFGAFASFVETAKKYGVRKADNIVVSASEKGKRVTLSVDIPKDTQIVSGEPVKVKQKTKKQEKVQKQIEDHKTKKENGEDEAYVPPVGRKTPPKVAKIKCPKCNVRKQVVTVAGVKSIKPHTIKGEPCPGSGVQVVKKGKTLVAQVEQPSNEEK